MLKSRLMAVVGVTMLMLPGVGSAGPGGGSGGGHGGGYGGGRGDYGGRGYYGGRCSGGVGVYLGAYDFGPYFYGPPPYIVPSDYLFPPVAPPYYYPPTAVRPVPSPATDPGAPPSSAIVDVHVPPMQKSGFRATRRARPAVFGPSNHPSCRRTVRSLMMCAHAGSVRTAIRSI